jgi:acyl-CoA reductase-like NAD-dependent aldehyde dehydrogenase
VCGGVLPWNFPFLLYSWKLAPALVAGNTYVLKPSEKTPLTAQLLAELFNEVGLPAGVFNVVNGYGAIGAALAGHMDVDKIAFTGSVATGKKIMEAAARSNLKKVTLELGGKSPLIVFADADLDVAVEVAHQGLFGHQGQVCIAASRIFVEESIYDEFVKRSVERAKRRTIGTPLVPTNETGPIVDKIQFDRILSYIDIGKKEGAKLLTGGCSHGNKGFFIEPTVFADVDDSMTIAKEEIFGPVMSLLKFKDINDVIRRANDSPFGLAASVITNDVRKAHTVSAQLRAGSVFVNCHGVVNPRAPFGGFKQSGIGRENGEEGLKEYLIVKTVCVALK